MFAVFVFFVACVGFAIVSVCGPDDFDAIKADMKIAKDEFWNDYVMGHFEGMKL